MNKLLLYFLLILFTLPSISQENSWFFLRAKSASFNPEFEKSDGKLIYTGIDIKLKSVLKNYSISVFKKTFKNASSEHLKKTFFVVSDKKGLMEDLLKITSHLFEFAEIIEDEDKKIFEPNDYGLTSTIGENIGLQINLDYMDFIEAPKAWYYTTGSKDMIVGISDATVDTTNTDFKEKTTVIRKSSLSKGHGSGVASIAAGQGNNAYGLPGVCYDCSIYATSYGNFRKFEQLLELSNAGVKVINCSWVNSRYYETAQAVIDEMFENGTIIVAAAGNENWKNTNGEKINYPASYNHVISVAAVMHRYETVNDKILKTKKGFPYAANVKNYVGRTVGFKDNDTLKKHHIWPVSTTTLNSEVDILAPSVDLFRFSKFVLTGEELYTMEASSSTAPFVTGTIGLMWSLNPCLPIDEVETILKLSANYIGNIEANKPFVGHYGAGSLNAGEAVKMVYDLYSEKETTIIEGQEFSRWDFKLTSLSKEVLIQNQIFSDDATLALTSKNKIIIGANTVLKPNLNGRIVLKIDPSLEKQCELQLREGFPNNNFYHPEGAE